MTEDCLEKGRKLIEEALGLSKKRWKLEQRRSDLWRESNLLNKRIEISEKDVREALLLGKLPEKTGDYTRRIQIEEEIKNISSDIQDSVKKQRQLYGEASKLRKKC